MSCFSTHSGERAGRTDGGKFKVKFLDCIIFNTEDDDRDYDEEKDDYILSIEQHLIEEIKERVLMANRVGDCFK
jgi:hypothetical protein